MDAVWPKFSLFFKFSDVMDDAWMRSVPSAEADGLLISMGNCIDFEAYCFIRYRGQYHFLQVRF